MKKTTIRMVTKKVARGRQGLRKKIRRMTKKNKRCLSFEQLHLVRKKQAMSSKHLKTRLRLLLSFPWVREA